jgi:DNA topoisomerase-1
MSPETVTLDQALRLLSLPRVVGVDPDDGQEVIAMNGRYGPFIKKGSETRSLETEGQVFTITLDDALHHLSQPRRRRGRATARAPLRELGVDPATDRPVVIKEGRFGPYVTDGDTNAGIRGGDSVESLTLERGLELLAERRSKGPSRPRRGRRARS